MFNFLEKISKDALKRVAEKIEDKIVEEIEGSLNEITNKVATKLESSVENSTSKLKEKIGGFSENQNNEFAKEIASTSIQIVDAFKDNVIDSSREFKRDFQGFIDARQWLEGYYLKNDICLIDEEKKWNGEYYNNKGKKIDEIIYLDLKNIGLKGTLDISNFTKLKYLDCQKNQLTGLILPNSNSLEVLICNDNELTNLNLDNYVNLQELNCFNNELSNIDLNIFAHLTNLVSLNIGKNEFVGSLSALKDCNKLNFLNITKTEIKGGLEYLSESLDNIVCDNDIKNQLSSYGNSLITWKAYHSDLMNKAGKVPVKLTNYNFETSVLADWFLSEFDIFLPNFFSPDRLLKLRRGYEKLRIADNRYNFEISSFYERDYHPWNWESSPVNLNRKDIPKRLYNLNTNRIEDTVNRNDISNYIILSYVWGEKDSMNEWWEVIPENFGQNYIVRPTIFGKRALNKAKATWQYLKGNHNLNTDYIWIDNFCINQDDRKEKSEEIAKLRQYYSNAVATLVNIDSSIDDEEELLEFNPYLKVCSSFWSSRAWTFQEGMLSKQTIFMFDNHLVDGRSLALEWAGRRENYSRLPKTFITPFGQSYQNYHFSKDINLSLGEALSSVSHRGQAILIDKVHSILGLLPYGKEVKVEYKPNICNKCPNKIESKDCNHDGKDKKWPIYTRQDLEIKLTELAEKAYTYDPKEVLTYLGERDSNNWWLPKINENFQLSIKGALKNNHSLLSNIIKVKKNGLQLRGYYYNLDDGCKVVSLDKWDWNDESKEMIWFILDNEKNSIVIEKTNPLTFFKHIKKILNFQKIDHSQDIFINMVNKEVIFKSEQPEIYEELVNDNELENSIEFYNQDSARYYNR
ncbi:MAG: hypothetical protein mread185_000359 [Mycoplasmataceae bacterium]|nr:MAG: hypothetical protein mread185_000359 [Mycoplasmataceae bacterium]